MLVSGFHEFVALLEFGFIAESSGSFQQAISVMLFLAKIK